jgi:hypothetical protein
MRFVSIILLSMLAAPSAFPNPENAASNVERQMREWACTLEDLDAASHRLLELRDADQASRINGDLDPEEDTQRRVEVAKIYAEGCLQRGEDFRHAALVFQHGNSPEHYYQAWYFASRAVALGDEQAKWLVPRAIDRYFLNTGYKQLFGTNLVTPFLWGSQGDDSYLCLWPVEESLSDEVRSQYAVQPLDEIREQYADAENSALNPQTNECPVNAEAPPKGMFPGIW